MKWTLVLIVITVLFYAAPLVGQLIVAHRGASHDAPENTRSAFKLAWEQNADAIEGDFYITADQRIVCIHDKDTQRTAGKNLNVSESTLAELRKLDVGQWKHERFSNERIPTLEEVLAIVPDDKLFLIELKSGAEIVEPLHKVLSDAPIDRNRLRIICFNADVVAACKKAMPGIKAFWLTSFKQNEDTGKWSPTVEEVLATLKRIHCDGVDTQAEKQVVTRTFIDKIRTAGFEYHLWTVDDPADAIHFANLGVDSITTNRPAFLREAIEKSRETKPE